MPDSFDAYKTLQVDPEADPEVIQAAYRRLAQKYHPDLTPDVPGGERMTAINRAWEILRDPGRRAAYDLERQASRRSTISRETGAASAGSQSGAGEPTRPSGGRAGKRPGSGSSAPIEEVSGNWTSGRSNVGGGYDPASMGMAQGTGAAGAPPGNPSGSVLNFGRYSGWSLGEVARRDLEYIEWLDRTPIGRPYREEIDTLLRASGRRRAPNVEASERRGLFRRR